MGLPVWKTVGGDLGVIEERVFYKLQLEAEETSGQNISYTLVSGKLPDGLILRTDGSVDGYPRVTDVLQGTPFDVSRNIKSTFVVRIQNQDGVVNDRTFSLTVTGQDKPRILTTAEQLGEYVDGQRVDIQLEAEDLDRDTLTWYLANGELPPGLVINPTGLISGWIEPTLPNFNATVGFDATEFDKFEYDFGTISVSRNYQFAAGVSDGKDIVQRNYTIYVHSANNLTADTTNFTADQDNNSTIVDTSYSNQRTPVVLTPPQDLGVITHDNYFAFKFNARDFDGDPIKFSIAAGAAIGFDSDSAPYDSEIFDRSDLELPPGLTLDEDTGWLYGTLPYLYAVQQEYEFGIRVYKENDPDFISPYTFFTATIVGDLANLITWQTPQDLGTIKTGQISEFAISAVTQLGNKSLKYRLVPGSRSKLPQGLILQESGLIVGRASFEKFSMDGGATTFDETARNYNETTFDSEFEFTVEAYDVLPENETDTVTQQIRAVRTFTIGLEQDTIKPWEALYVQAGPKTEFRDYYLDLVNNQNIFDPELIYRKSDYYFGKQDNLRMLVASGLNPKQATDYVQAMQKNHYDKNLYFGDVKKAVARNSDDSIAYEVIYIELYDDATNTSGTSTSKYIKLRDEVTNPLSVDGSYPSVDLRLDSADNQNDRDVWPNSIKNMRDQMQNTIGRLDPRTLPSWMTSKQLDGRVLGQINAAIIAYVKPDSADEIIYNINQSGFDFKRFTFEFDKYIWDSNLSAVFDKDSEQYIASLETTFDTNTTIFDQRSTRFINNLSSYVPKDYGDKYLKFPRTGVFR